MYCFLDFTASTAFSFGGDSFVEYVVKESFQRQQLLDAAKADTRRRRRDTIPSSQTISMSFRTGSSHGLLLLVESGADFTVLQVCYMVWTPDSKFILTLN